jgi:hypothetical protein
MEAIEIILWTIGICSLIWIIQKLLSIFKKKKAASLSSRIKAKSDRKFNKLLNRFRHEHKRKPTRNELFRIIISASHITVRRRGQKGHWGRQRIRKYLLEKHDVVANYEMR